MDLYCGAGTIGLTLADKVETLGYKTQTAVPFDLFPRTSHVETVCCLYHQKKDFISVPYKPKDAEYLKQPNKIGKSLFRKVWMYASFRKGER